MKICYAVVLAALAGAGIGGLTVERLHAQAKPPAYYIAEIDVTNEDLYNKEWAPKADATIKAAGGIYLVRGTNIERIEGAAPKRLLNPRPICGRCRSSIRRSNRCAHTRSKA
jgi:hypothetical protein